MIPAPQIDTLTGGELAIPPSFTLHAKGIGKADLVMFQVRLDACMDGIHTFTQGDPQPLQLILDPAASNHPDGYTLDIAPTGISIAASAIPGLRYGLQSLVQLLYLAHRHNSGRLLCRHIEDSPRFAWRGLHLDVSRHFFPVSFIRQYLDWMHALKLNRFHWHLSDDQGWRLESRRFPLLHEKGAWRREPDGSAYGGYYTRQEVLGIVEYAASLGIEVIPEIDIPGHTQAILAAYPDLACFPRDFACLNVWGISENILCAGKDGVIGFLKELLSEVAELFPSPYVHLGGDEAPKTYWKQCPHCQQRIRDKALRGEEELQSWLLDEMLAHLRSLGKQVIGWDEILDGNIDSLPIVMVWRGDGRDAALKAETNGNRYILCPNRVLYFDWKQQPDSAGAHGVSTLSNVYGFDPAALTGNPANLLLGAQANVWTEYMPDAESVRAMLFPRVYALAELLWTPQDQRSEPDFLLRLQQLEGCL